ncbi:MAG: tetratricopeptide repeat protein, partial [Pirellulaceae bacterium]
TTLLDVLRDTQRLLPENVVEVLVGEAFNRLDRPAQQVMQALAIYGRPVPPVAVDFLLAPHVPGIDSAPLLNRLLNMQLVRKEGGRFYLHPIDRDYALGRVEEGEPGDCLDGVPRFSRYALRHRGAEFFRQARKPRSDWKTLDDLFPQLAEFDLRFLNGDSQTAFAIVREIDFRYLMIWGHYRLMADMHLRLKGRLEDPRSRQQSCNSLGLALENLGNYDEASATYEEAIRLAREIGARNSEAVALSNQAICHVRLGETARAIQCNTQALEIVRALGDLPSTVSNLNNLANRYADLGDNRQSLLLYDEALPIARQFGNRYAEAVILESSGHVLLAMDRFAEADTCYRGALRIADEINSVQVQNYAHSGLALLALMACDLAAARREAEAATHYAVPDNDHHVLSLLGIIRLRQGDTRAATEAFQESVKRCDRMLQLTTRNYAAMDSKAVAKCGLILCGADVPLGDVRGLLRAARAINRDAGIVARLLRLLSALAKSDRDNRLSAILQAAAGEP